MKESKADKRLRKQHEEDLRHVLSTAQGRRFFFRLVDAECGLTRSSYTGEASGTAYNEGRRSIGAALMDAAQRVAPELYMQALQEEMRARAEESIQREAEAQRRKEREEDDGQ